MRKLALIVARLTRLLVALTVVAYATALRPWHMGWGATDQERSSRLEGDRFIPAGAVVSTRALTIEAPVADVWRWIVQLGHGRGGFYSYTWLENLFAAGMRNADSLDRRRAAIHVGDSIAVQPDGPAAIVRLVVPYRALVLDHGWTLAVRPLDQTRTRLIVRFAYDCRSSPIETAFYYTIFEPAHFVMESGMMLGIRERAERTSARRAQQGGLSARSPR